MPVAKKAGPPALDAVAFLDLGMYTGGYGLPDGDYCLFFDVRMFQAKNAAGQTRGPQRLGVMVSAYDLADPRPENVREQFYSMGTNADKCFAPNPETGKGLVAIPGAPGVTLNHSTNWALFLKSLYDSGLFSGMAEPPSLTDFTVIDGIHVHTTQVDEPEERKGFRSTTGEAAMEGQQEGPKKIAVITAILDSGKPWEGTGGLPEAPAAPAPVPAKVTTIKAPVKVNGKPQPVPPVAAAEAGDEAEVLMEHASAAMAAVLAQTKYANGCSTLILKTNTFAEAKKAADEPTANKVVKQFFATDEALNRVLGPLGYSGSVKPQGQVTVIA
jgi:hypothetical protein